MKFTGGEEVSVEPKCKSATLLKSALFWKQLDCYAMLLYKHDTA